MKRGHWAWAAVVVGTSLLSCHRAFSTSRIFFHSDATFRWWPLQRWVRQAFAGDGSLLWDPYVALGQSPIVDPNQMLFFPPVLLLRLLPGAVLGFNLSLALACPVGALGMYHFLRRHVSDEAAAVGALLLALSGPVQSLGYLMNHAWALALVPWILSAVHAVAERGSWPRCVLLAILLALQLLAGEPLTLVTTTAIASAYCLFVVPGKAKRVAASVAASAGLAALLGAIQLVPLADALGRSVRGAGRLRELQAIHPYRLLESLAGHVFGDPFAPVTARSPWIGPLNGDADPYLPSLYVGVGVLALAALGSVAGSRRSRAFWLVAFAALLLCALGSHTPVYPALQGAVPVLGFLRYPAKYACLAMVALAVLAAVGWQSLSRAGPPRYLPLALAVLAFVSGIVALVGVAPNGIPATLAAQAGITHPLEAGRFLSATLPAGAARVALVAAVSAILLWLARATTRRGAWARGLLLAGIGADLLYSTAALNPTLDRRFFEEPDWVGATRKHPSDRVHVAGRVAWTLGPEAEEGILRTDPFPAGASASVVGGLQNGMFPPLPGAWRFREAISIDQSGLWSAHYGTMIEQFGGQAPDARARYLERVGVRYHVVPRPPYPEAVRRQSLLGFAPMALYEGREPTPRAIVVIDWSLEPDPDRQTARMFAADFDPRSVVLLSVEPPPAAGRPGTPTGAAAEILEDGDDTITIRAAAPEGGGFLLLADSYDPHWRVAVDGEPASLLRANGLFRAVRIGPGEHMVRFAYRPLPFYAGGALTALALVASIFAVLGVRTRRCEDRPRAARRSR